MYFLSLFLSLPTPLVGGAARLSGNALVSINVVTVRRARLVLGWVGDHVQAGKRSRYVASQLGRLSLLPSVGW